MTKPQQRSAFCIKKKKKLASGSVKKKIAILPRENPLTIFLLIMKIGKVFQWL